MKILSNKGLHESLMYPKKIQRGVDDTDYDVACPSCKSHKIDVIILHPNLLYKRRCSCLECGTVWNLREKIPIRYAQKTSFTD